MEITIKHYQCSYRLDNKDKNRYEYKILWDDVITSFTQLNDIVKLLRNTYREEAHRKRPVAIAVFTQEEDRSIEELAGELG